MMPPHKNRSRSTGGLHWGSVWWKYSGIPGNVGAVGMFSWNIDFNHLLTVRTHTDTDWKSQEFYREKLVLSLCPWPNPAWLNNQLSHRMKGRGREEKKCKERKEYMHARCSLQKWRTYLQILPYVDVCWFGDPWNKIIIMIIIK